MPILTMIIMWFPIVQTAYYIREKIRHKETKQRLKTAKENNRILTELMEKNEYARH